MDNLLVVVMLGSLNLCDNECGANATSFCDACTMKFCQHCFQDIHSKAAFKKHQSSPIEEAKKKNPSCSKHKEELKLLCKNCNIPICLICQFGEHKGHDVILLEDYSIGIKGNIAKEAKELELRAKKLEESAQSVEKEMNTLKSVPTRYFHD